MEAFTTRPELRGTFGMVASTHWLASAAGMAVLERGGNAFDAAVAAGFTLQVVEPHLNGPGGEVPALFYSVDRGEPLTLCGQGVAPAAATIERFRELGYDLIPGTGVLAACVPGAFGGWLLLLQEFGTWSLEEVLAFAIGYADNGFPVVGGMRLSIERQADLIAGWPASSDLYLPVPETRVAVPQSRARGDVSANRPGIRRGLPRRSRSSARASSSTRASWPTRFIASVQQEGGLLTRDDLSAWRATFEPVVSYEYGETTVCKTGPWGAGPVALQQLALLEGFDVAALSEAEFVHVVTECAKLAFADRDALYGDVDVPLETLLSREYNDTRRALIGDDASSAYQPGMGRLPTLVDAEQMAGAGEPTRGDTVHVDVVDRWGNMISATPSGGWLYGSPVIPELGWPLGTRAQMFWLEEGLPSSLRPGARPRTTLVARPRTPRREAVARLGNARRRPAGAVGVPRLSAPRRSGIEPAGGDRRAGVPHGPPDLVLLPARLRPPVAGSRGEVRPRRDRRSTRARTRRDRRTGLVARASHCRPKGGRPAAELPRIPVACRVTLPAARRPAN